MAVNTQMKFEPTYIDGYFLLLQEFIRVGYYVSNEYDDPEMQETPPETPLFDKLTRNILASNPRVTKFKINWDSTTSQVRKLIQLLLRFQMRYNVTAISQG